MRGSFCFCCTLLNFIHVPSSGQHHHEAAATLTIAGIPSSLGGFPHYCFCLPFARERTEKGTYNPKHNHRTGAAAATTTKHCVPKHCPTPTPPNRGTPKVPEGRTRPTQLYNQPTPPLPYPTSASIEGGNSSRPNGTGLLGLTRVVPLLWYLLSFNVSFNGKHHRRKTMLGNGSDLRRKPCTTEVKGGCRQGYQ